MVRPLPALPEPPLLALTPSGATMPRRRDGRLHGGIQSFPSMSRANPLLGQEQLSSSYHYWSDFP